MVTDKFETYRKYPFRKMEVGETFKLDEGDVRRAQKLAHYYRVHCKRPLRIKVTRTGDGHYCERLA